MEFTYEGLVRYSFGFSNPNHAAALISMLIPILWGLRRIFRGRIAFACIFIPEIILYLALIATVSRTGIAATILGSAFFFYLTHKHWGRRLDGKSVLLTILIVIGACIILFAFGLLKRHYSWIGAPDDSILNRLNLWMGGIQMLADTPSGAGTGLSGRIFTDFYQASGSTLVFRTMVNSFLTFMVEQGIILSFLAAIPLFFSFVASFISLRCEMPDKRKYLIISLMASCFCTLFSGMASTCFDLSAICNFFSGPHDLNSFLQTLLSAMSVVLFISLIYLPLGYLSPLQIKTGLLASLAASVITVSALLLAGTLIDSREKASCAVSEKYGMKMLTAAPKAEYEGKMLVISEGKTSNRKNIAGFIRSRYAGFSADFPLVSTKNPENLFENYDYVFLCGGNAAPACSGGKTKFIFYDPTSFIPVDPGRIEKVYLGQFDEFGCNAKWEGGLPADRIQYLY